MPFTVWMQCGCVLDAVDETGAALCTDHPVARPIRRQHHTAHGFGPVESAVSGSWQSLTEPVTFLSYMTQTAQVRRDQPETTEVEIRHFTRGWLRLQAAMRPSPVAIGRFQTLEIDAGDD